MIATHTHTHTYKKNVQRQRDRERVEAKQKTKKKNLEKNNSGWVWEGQSLRGIVNLNHWPWWIAIFHYLLNASVDLKNGWSDYLFFLVAVTTFVHIFDIYYMYSLTHTHTHTPTHTAQSNRTDMDPQEQHTYKIYTVFRVAFFFLVSFRPLVLFHRFVIVLNVRCFC